MFGSLELRPIYLGTNTSQGLGINFLNKLGKAAVGGVAGFITSGGSFYGAAAGAGISVFTGGKVFGQTTLAAGAGGGIVGAVGSGMIKDSAGSVFGQDTWVGKYNELLKSVGSSIVGNNTVQKTVQSTASKGIQNLPYGAVTGEGVSSPQQASLPYGAVTGEGKQINITLPTKPKSDYSYSLTSPSADTKPDYSLLPSSPNNPISMNESGINPFLNNYLAPATKIAEQQGWLVPSATASDAGNIPTPSTFTDNIKKYFGENMGTIMLVAGGGLLLFVVGRKIIAWSGRKR